MTAIKHLGVGILMMICLPIILLLFSLALLADVGRDIATGNCAETDNNPYLGQLIKYLLRRHV